MAGRVQTVAEATPTIIASYPANRLDSNRGLVAL